MNPDYMWFCVHCFQNAYETGCVNCGASNSQVLMPIWAAKSIRDNSSWIGKRYYTTTEDLEHNEELVDLRSKMTSFPGRHAEESYESGLWMVTQKRAGNKTVSVTVQASSANQALEESKTMLPYVADWRH